MQGLKRFFRKLQSFSNGKSLIFGRDSLCLYIRFQKPEYLMMPSSWNTIETVDDKMIEFGVERSQNNKITYFNFFRLRIYLSQFEVNKKSYLESIDFHKVPERYKNSALEQISLNRSRQQASFHQESDESSGAIKEQDLFKALKPFDYYAKDPGVIKNTLDFERFLNYDSSRNPMADSLNVNDKGNKKPMGLRLIHSDPKSLK